MVDDEGSKYVGLFWGGEYEGGKSDSEKTRKEVTEKIIDQQESTKERSVEKNFRQKSAFDYIAVTNERNESSKSNSIAKKALKVVGFVLLMLAISVVIKLIFIGKRELGF